MNKRNLTCLSLAVGTTFVLGQIFPAPAQSNWQTVADFESITFTTVDALTRDAAGNLYAAISSSDTQDLRHAQVRKSSDHGATWSTVEDLVCAFPGAATFVSLGADAAGHIYAAGSVTDEQSRTRWIVKKSDEHGGAWSTVDDFVWPASPTTGAEGFATDTAGNLYVVGSADEPLSNGKTDCRAHWLVRQSRDGGRTWSTVDDYTHGFSARATAIVSTGNRLLVAGSGSNGKSNEHWLVREATADESGGLRWRTVDEFQLEEQPHGFSSRALGLGVDSHGSVYAVGRSDAMADGAVSKHWIVRRASHGRGDWVMVDKFQLNAGYFASASGIAADDQGGVYVIGYAKEKDAGVHWIVRKSATGDAGSWLVSDDFQGLLPAPAVKLPEAVTQAADGSLTSRPYEFASGREILADSSHIFAAGSVSAASYHAIVRKLKLARCKELTAASAR